ncbi:aminoglycoside phosphotransferase family protein [Jiangella aurantiaca]|uniref:Aminoglycoside phosphotransferase family protein n=1 Tax=Jiangella aurantiaca TaxID=2530373 RepID=A0A4R5AKC4_9ACTN|nr:aminoglycoside phosphotransferase family protein [Jiangella aurantiaca]TDD70492.1 aminoglycoside phosphotransferase family protein [Jiangella aurantiaca]
MPRAAGVRVRYERIPPAVRDWVETSLGSAVTTTTEQTGGMSPGCATRLVTAGGQTAFVKAVGASLQPDTPLLFRREIAVLGWLPPAPYRPALLGSYDDGDWVALLLEDVDGRPPDLADPYGADATAVRALVDRQARELTPSPPGVVTRRLPDVAERWRERWAELAGAPEHALPPWMAGRIATLYRRVARLPERLAVESLCHWDVREDNLLIRPDDAVVILDWGMSCLGPSWADAFMLALTWVDTPAFDELMAERPVDDDLVTDLALAFAGSQAWRGARPAPPRLPTLSAYCRAEAERAFAGVHRRLGWTSASSATASCI